MRRDPGPPSRPRPAARPADAERGRVAPLDPAEALAGALLAAAARRGVRADGRVLPDPVPADERQAAHPARPAAPRVHALRHTFLPTDTLLLHAAAAEHRRSRSSCSRRCSGASGAAGPVRRRCTWSSSSGRSSGCSRAGASGSTRHRQGRRPSTPRRLPSTRVYLVLALFLAHTFLAYFVGVEQLVQWVRRSPLRASRRRSSSWPATTALIFFDFA